MRPTKRAVAIGFGLAIAVMSSYVLAQRAGGGGRGGGSGGASFSQGGGARGGSYHGWGGHYRGGHGGHYHGGHRHGHHHGGHWHSSVSIGFGWPYWYGSYYAPYAYGYPYYYAPYAYAPYGYPAYGYPAYAYEPYGSYAPAEPVTYVERSNRYATREPSAGYWHYCRESNTYYPYVRECAGQWERVPATPAVEP